VGRYEDALQSYREALVQAPTSLDSGDVLYAMGNLYLEHLHDYDAALKQFQQVTRHHRRGVSYLRSLVAIPQCYLRQGDLTLAREAYRVLANQSSAEDIQEEAAYHQALISFFNRQYDTAAAGFQRLVVEHPRGFYVNDALQLIMLMNTAGGDTAALADYATALFYRTRQMPDSARRYLNKAADNSPELGDWSLLLLTDIDLSTADTTAALAALERLISDFSDSYYLPYAMKRKADILMSRQGASSEALDIYKQLLEGYPDYPFITDIRKKLRAADSTRSIG
jgi:tetratricopeptide (TPR) repeat protein